MLDVKKFSSLDAFDLLEDPKKKFADLYVFKRKDKEMEEASLYSFRLNVSGDSIKKNLEFFFSLMKDIDAFIFFEESGVLEIAYERGKKESLIPKLQIIAQTLEMKSFFPKSGIFKDHYFLVLHRGRVVTHPFSNLPMLDCFKIDSEKEEVARCLDASGVLGSEIHPTPVSDKAEQSVPLSTKKKMEEQHQSFLKSLQKIPATFFMKLASNIKLAVLLCACVGAGAGAFLFFGVNCLPVLGAFTLGLTVGFFSSSARKNDKKESELENTPLRSA